MRSWRWIRVAIPCAVTAMLVAGTVVAHQLQTPDIQDPAFLSPASTAPTGAATLAGQLRQAGIPVEAVASSRDAVLAAAQRPSTLFIPAPALVDPDLFGRLDALPAGSRVVLVAPGDGVLARSNLPAYEQNSRWAPAVADPGADCTLPEAVRAGRAGIAGVTYGTLEDGAASCYHDALVTFDGPGLAGRTGVTVVLAGASDPFRNDRISEHGNAMLATGLLSTLPQVIWLDLHHLEKPAKSTPTKQPGTANSPPPPEAGNRPTVADLFPPWVWAFLGLLTLVGLTLALGVSRRLGGVVTEPMPVAAWSSETVTGRGRLYHRAGDRGAALDALRESARARLAGDLGLPPSAEADALVAAVSTAAGVDPDQVRAILYDDQPRDDQQLRAAVERLDTLVAVAQGHGPAGRAAIVPIPATLAPRPPGPDPGAPA